MVSPRTVIRLAAMGLLAAGPTTAALVAPSAGPSRPTPQQQAPLRSAGKERPRDLQPVRVSSRPAVGRLGRGAEQKLAVPVAGSGKRRVVPRAVVRPLVQESPPGDPGTPAWVVHRVRWRFPKVVPCTYRKLRRAGGSVHRPLAAGTPL